MDRNRPGPRVGFCNRCTPMRQGQASAAPKARGRLTPPSVGSQGRWQTRRLRLDALPSARALACVNRFYLALPVTGQSPRSCHSRFAILAVAWMRGRILACGNTPTPSSRSSVEFIQSWNPRVSAATGLGTQMLSTGSLKWRVGEQPSLSAIGNALLQIAPKPCVEASRLRLTDYEKAPPDHPSSCGLFRRPVRP